MGRAYPRIGLRGCLKPKWPDHLSSRRFGTQSCADVSSESGRTTSAQGIFEVRVAGRRMRKWPSHHVAGHLRCQSFEDVSKERGGESGRTTIRQGISEVKVLMMPEAKVA